MRQPPIAATCTQCGTWNPPDALRCATCGVQLRESTNESPRSGQDDGIARIVGLALIVVSALVIAVVLPTAMRDGASAPAATTMALAAASAPSTPTPTPAATRSPLPSPTPPPTTAPASATPTPQPTPTNPPAAGSPGTTAAPTPSARPATPRTVALPSLSVDVAGATKIVYFGISGRSPDGLLRSMERKARALCDAEAIACVALTPDIRPTGRTTSSGSCVLTGAKTSLRAVVYVPRWVKPSRVYPQLLAWWRDVLDHITWHEERHIRIEKSWLKKAAGMFEGKACSSAQRIADRWTVKVEAAQAAFDAKDYATYELPPYTGPIASGGS